ncbi:MAG: phasin family protein [Xanthomonadales bacterium]
MVRKKLKKKVRAKPAASRKVNSVVDSAREIWLAGLGALSVAKAEGGKIIDQGGKLFDKLVAEGSKLEKRTRKDVEGAADELRGDVESRFGGVREQAESVRKQASDNWGKLEKIFENRVSRSLGRLGIPTRDDVNDLAKRVRKLSRQVAAMDKQAKPAANKAAAKKTTVRKAAPKAP